MLAKDLSKMLAQRAQEIAQMIFPAGEKIGSEWCIGSLSGEKGQSLKIHLTGTKAGLWSDFQTGEGGDLLDLWAMNARISIAGAMQEVAAYLNVQLTNNKMEKNQYKKKMEVFTKPKPQTFATLMPSSPVHRYLSQDRCLTHETINAFLIPHSNDEIVFNYYRGKDLIFVKKLKLERKNDQKQIVVSANAEPCLFGWDLIPKQARYVVICEGEIDAMSFYQYGIPALSVPFGGGRGDKQKWIEYEYERLNRFDEIFICMDDDDAGKEGAKEIVGRLGAYRCRIVELPMKDANECLVNGISGQDMKYFIKEARTLDPETLRRHDEFTVAAYDLIHPTPGKFLGYTLGWDKLGDNILFRPSGLTMWTGYNGHGKTMFLSHVMLNMINQGAKICIASMELYPEELMERIYLQASAQSKPSMDYLKKINEWADGRLYLFNLVGTANIAHLLDVFLYARIRYGVDVFIVDSLTTLNIAEDDYNAQKQLTEMLRDFKLQHNCHIHLVAHPRKPRDEKEIPGKYDIRGGGAISDLADNCLAVWRNKEKEFVFQKQAKGEFLDEKETEKLTQFDAYLKCDKNRHGRGRFKEGVFGFWFNDSNFQYYDNKHKVSRPIVELPCLES